MDIVKMYIRRDSSTASTVDVPDFEAEVLKNLHTDAVEVSRQPAPMELQADVLENPTKYHDGLVIKYQKAAREDRGNDTGHPALQVYRTVNHLIRAIDIDPKAVAAWREENARKVVANEQAEAQAKAIAAEAVAAAAVATAAAASTAAKKQRVAA